MNIMAIGHPILPSVSEMSEYIRQKARELGIDENVAIEVAKSEGMQPGVWQSTYKTKAGTPEESFGPFQLYDPPSGKGLGSEFRLSTGLNPRNPAYWKEGVDFALGKAKKGGWGPWYGAKRVGIDQWQGIREPQTIEPAGGPQTGANMPQMPINIDPLAQQPQQEQRPTGIGGWLQSQFGQNGSYWDIPIGARMYMAGAGLAGDDIDPLTMGKFAEMARKRKAYAAMRQSLSAKFAASGNQDMAQQVMSWSDEQLDAYTKGESEDYWSQKSEEREDIRKKEDDRRAHGFRLDELKQQEYYKNQPTRDWLATMDRFAKNNKLENASSKELWEKKSGISDLQQDEIELLATASDSDEYSAAINTIKDNRVNRSGTGSDLVDIKEGIQLVPDGKGGYKTIQIPGGKAEREAQKSATEGVKSNEYMWTLNTNIGRETSDLMDLYRKWEAGEIDASSFGSGSSVIGTMPLNTDAAVVKGHVDSLRANLGAKNLSEMRFASPTGAAAGNVSDQEQYLFQFMSGPLNQNTPEALFQTASRIHGATADFVTLAPGTNKSVMQNAIDKLIARPTEATMAAFDRRYGTGAARALVEHYGARQ